MILVFNAQGPLQVLVSLDGTCVEKLRCLMERVMLQSSVLLCFHILLLHLLEFHVWTTTSTIGQMYLPEH